MMRYEKEDWRLKFVPEEGVLSKQKMRRGRIWFRRKGHREIEREYKKDSRALV